ncbi:MAG TPA: hypothetical protein VLK23_05265 [Thermodesulfobacteriota bacterium]|nr:hypothetical protein [Thermodesulfobacteriota bacterium]
MSEKREGQRLESVCLAVAEIIRRQSERGQLVSPEEIRARLTELGFLKSGEEQRSLFEVIIQQAIEEQGDLREIEGKNGVSRYYSSIYMGDKYVKILIQKGEDPLLMIAEMVRENSKIYPRPIPIDIFSGSPFEFSKEVLLDFLKEMGKQEEYQDIARTTTSMGRIYLYSTHHLEPDFASTLAEWLDVGQASNP